SDRRKLLQLGLVEGQRRHHHRGMVLLRLHEDALPDLAQSRFEALEVGDLAFERDVVRKWRLGNHSSSRGGALRTKAPPRAHSRSPPCRLAPRRNGGFVARGRWIRAREKISCVRSGAFYCVWRGRRR